MTARARDIRDAPTGPPALDAEARANLLRACGVTYARPGGPWIGSSASVWRTRAAAHHAFALRLAWAIRRPGVRRLALHGRIGDEAAMTTYSAVRGRLHVVVWFVEWRSGRTIGVLAVMARPGLAGAHVAPRLALRQQAHGSS